MRTSTVITSLATVATLALAFTPLLPTGRAAWATTEPDGLTVDYVDPGYCPRLDPTRYQSIVGRILRPGLHEVPECDAQVFQQTVDAAQAQQIADDLAEAVRERAEAVEARDGRRREWWWSRGVTR